MCPSGEEVSRINLKSLFKYTLVKKILLGAICLYFYLDPTWFPTGISSLALIIVVAVDFGIDLIVSGFLFGVMGIRQEMRVRKR